MKVRNLTTSASDTQPGNKKTRLRNPTELSIPAEIATDYSRPNNMELKSTSSNFRRGVVATMDTDWSIVLTWHSSQLSFYW
jgi:hypothetical protein